ncbi:MAG: hypothetical protein ACRED5_18605 [Propylenella sp.]
MLPAPRSIREYLDRLPTTDLYFLNALRALRAAKVGSRLPPLRNIAPNVYAVGRTGVIVRYGREEDVDRLKQAGIKQLIYIADDDFAAGAEDEHLPERYRRKLAAFAHSPWPKLRDAADIVIVPGSVLAAAYGEKALTLPPAWHRPPALTEHFRPDTIEIVHLGTGSHIADLAALAPTIAEALSVYPHARLTLFSGEQTPEPLRKHPQVRVRRPMAWWRYKLSLPRMRYQLALYPLADTAFNRARSANKLYEHALVGAASLLSPNAALREAAGQNLSHLFVEGGRREWASRLMSDLADPEALRRRADATRAHIAATDPLARSVAAWRDILSAEFS